METYIEHMPDLRKFVGKYCPKPEITEEFMIFIAFKNYYASDFPNTDYYSAFMDFIEEWLPDFSSNQKVFESDLYWRFLNDELDEEENPKDVEFFKETYHGNRAAAVADLVKIDALLAIQAFKICKATFQPAYKK